MHKFDFIDVYPVAGRTLEVMGELLTCYAVLNDSQVFALPITEELRRWAKIIDFVS